MNTSISTPNWTLRRLPALTDAQIEQLAGVLIDCVEGGASVSFMHPLTHERAVAFWRGVAQGVAASVREGLLRGAREGEALTRDVAERAADVVKMLFKSGMMVTINDTLDADTAALVVEASTVWLVFIDSKKPQRNNLMSPLRKFTYSFIHRKSPR